jgi:hypothetical protein
VQPAGNWNTKQGGSLSGGKFRGGGVREGGNCPVTIIDIMLCKNCQRGAATKKYWTCTVCGNLLINRGHVIQVHITTVKKFTLSLLGCIIKCLLCSVH